MSGSLKIESKSLRQDQFSPGNLTPEKQKQKKDKKNRFYTSGRNSDIADGMRARTLNYRENIEWSIITDRLTPSVASANVVNDRNYVIKSGMGTGKTQFIFDVIRKMKE